MVVVSFTRRNINSAALTSCIICKKQHLVKKQLPYFLAAFVLPVSAMLWWWGLFSSTSLEIGERGGYRYAYLEAQGVYSKLASKQAEVLFELKKQGIQPGAELTLVLTDPRTTPHDELKARTGYIISTDAQVQPPLLVDSIPMRKVAVAQIKAHPLFAYGKTYAALLDYAKIHGTELHLPTLELFDNSILSVEMPLSPENPPPPSAANQATDKVAS